MKSKLSLPQFILETKTLANRILALRNLNNLSIAELSKLTKIKIQQLEDIESGLDTWLSVVVRQKLANALKVEPVIIQEVEFQSYQDIKYIDKETCPTCNLKLIKKTYHGLDHNSLDIELVKYFCPKCPYVISEN